MTQPRCLVCAQVVHYMIDHPSWSTATLTLFYSCDDVLGGSCFLDQCLVNSVPREVPTAHLAALFLPFPSIFFYGFKIFGLLTLVSLLLAVFPRDTEFQHNYLEQSDTESKSGQCCPCNVFRKFQLLPEVKPSAASHELRLAAQLSPWDLKK